MSGRRRGKMPQPKPRRCVDCEHWTGEACWFPRSPKFLDTTGKADGCTPNKKARADWI